MLLLPHSLHSLLFLGVGVVGLFTVVYDIDERDVLRIVPRTSTRPIGGDVERVDIDRIGSLKTLLEWTVCKRTHTRCLASHCITNKQYFGLATFDRSKRKSV
jgi:hypothetical protein